MIEPSTWTEQDLKRLIADQIGESLTLDYKESAALQRSDGKKNELSKDVSAFANSAGGVLVYGIKENGHIPVAIDNGYDPVDISKEWIEQVINSRVSRRITGLRIYPVSLTETSPGRVAYVVEIPASTDAPHMAADHRYYKRFNFESVPMEDYEVRDVSRRYTGPNLHFGLLLKGDAPGLPEPAGPTVYAYLENLSPIAADFALVTFHLTTASRPIVAGLEAVCENLVTYAGQEYPTKSFKLEWRGALRLPIMQGTRFRVAEVYFVPTAAHDGMLFWEVLSPGSLVKRGGFTLSPGKGRLNVNVLEDEWQLASIPVWHV